jgi:hypothetical protein
MDRKVKKIKVHSLTGRITWELMRKAFQAVKRNHGAAGVDRVTIEMFERQLDQNLEALMKQLKDRSFQPRPLRRVLIPKGDGKTRPLGIPTVAAYCTSFNRLWERESTRTWELLRFLGFGMAGTVRELSLELRRDCEQVP